MHGQLTHRWSKGGPWISTINPWATHTMQWSSMHGLALETHGRPMGNPIGDSWVSAVFPWANHGWPVGDPRVTDSWTSTVRTTGDPWTSTAVKTHGGPMCDLCMDDRWVTTANPCMGDPPMGDPWMIHRCLMGHHCKPMGRPCRLLAYSTGPWIVHGFP